MDKLVAAKKVLAKQKAKNNVSFRLQARFTESEVELISKYAKLNQHNTITSYIRQCIADNIRLTKDLTTY